MYDLKMDRSVGDPRPRPAHPDERPRDQICELLPRLAGMMDKLVPIRSMFGERRTGI
jgi:hypothetical protein